MWCWFQSISWQICIQIYLTHLASQWLAFDSLLGCRPNDYLVPRGVTLRQWIKVYKMKPLIFEKAAYWLREGTQNLVPKIW